MDAFSGWIEQMKIAYIPDFLGITFNLAQGINGATEAEWKEFQMVYTRTVRKMHQDETIGYEGRPYILIYGL